MNPKNYINFVLSLKCSINSEMIIQYHHADIQPLSVFYEQFNAISFINDVIFEALKKQYFFKMLTALNMVDLKITLMCLFKENLMDLHFMKISCLKYCSVLVYVP